MYPALGSLNKGRPADGSGGAENLLASEFRGGALSTLSSLGVAAYDEDALAASVVEAARTKAATKVSTSAPLATIQRLLASTEQSIVAIETAAGIGKATGGVPSSVSSTPLHLEPSIASRRDELRARYQILQRLVRFRQATASSSAAQAAQGVSGGNARGAVADVLSQLGRGLVGAAPPVPITPPAPIAPSTVSAPAFSAAAAPPASSQASDAWEEGQVPEEPAPRARGVRISDEVSTRILSPPPASEASSVDADDSMGPPARRPARVDAAASSQSAGKGRSSKRAVIDTGLQAATSASAAVVASSQRTVASASGGSRAGASASSAGGDDGGVSCPVCGAQLRDGYVRVSASTGDATVNWTMVNRHIDRCTGGGGAEGGASEGGGRGSARTAAVAASAALLSSAALDEDEEDGQLFDEEPDGDDFGAFDDAAAGRQARDTDDDGDVSESVRVAAAARSPRRKGASTSARGAAVKGTRGKGRRATKLAGSDSGDGDEEAAVLKALEAEDDVDVDEPGGGEVNDEEDGEEEEEEEEEDRPAYRGRSQRGALSRSDRLQLTIQDDWHDAVYRARLAESGYRPDGTLLPPEASDSDGEGAPEDSEGSNGGGSDSDGRARKRKREGDSGSAGAAYVDPEAVLLEGGLTVPGRIATALFPYQMTGLTWLWALHRQRVGGILGDEMGLGKSVQVAGYLGALQASGKLTGPVLIVAPATVLAHWVRELQRWHPPLRVLVLHESAPALRSGAATRKAIIRAASHRAADVVVTTYEALRQQSELLCAVAWAVAVLDEGHRIRNHEAGVTVAAKLLPTPHRLILTGAPIQNRLRELWSLFDFVFPGRLGSLAMFEAQFAAPIAAGGWSHATAVQVQTAYQCALVLRDLIGPYLLRRLKRDVNAHLPTKTEQVLFCRLTPGQRSEYVAYLRSRDVTDVLDGRAQAFRAVTMLRKLCNHPLLLSAVDIEYEGDSEGGPGGRGRGRGGKGARKRDHGTMFDDIDEEEGAGGGSYGGGAWGPSSSSPADGGPSRLLRHPLLAGSGKLVVLAEILQLWHTEGHRALVFTQGRQMLNLIERYAQWAGYSYLRMDGNTPVSDRQALVDKYNASAAEAEEWQAKQDAKRARAGKAPAPAAPRGGTRGIFLFLLTTRVGGVGVNLTGANRVVIFDPDWNPSTDTQARERAWRLGQRRHVTVYRLITAGTIEEKIYHRQVFKTVLTQRVLSDPGTRRLFNFRDMRELFTLSDGGHTMPLPAAAAAGGGSDSGGGGGYSVDPYTGERRLGRGAGGYSSGGYGGGTETELMAPDGALDLRSGNGGSDDETGLLESAGLVAGHEAFLDPDAPEGERRGGKLGSGKRASASPPGSDDDGDEPDLYQLPPPPSSRRGRGGSRGGSRGGGSDYTGGGDPSSQTSVLQALYGQGELVGAFSHDAVDGGGHSASALRAHAQRVAREALRALRPTMAAPPSDAQPHKPPAAPIPRRAGAQPALASNGGGDTAIPPAVKDAEGAASETGSSMERKARHKAEKRAKKERKAARKEAKRAARRAAKAAKKAKRASAAASSGGNGSTADSDVIDITGDSDSSSDAGSSSGSDTPARAAPGERVAARASQPVAPSSTGPAFDSRAAAQQRYRPGGWVSRATVEHPRAGLVAWDGDGAAAPPRDMRLFRAGTQMPTLLLQSEPRGIGRAQVLPSHTTAMVPFEADSEALGPAAAATGWGGGRLMDMLLNLPSRLAHAQARDEEEGGAQAEQAHGLGHTATSYSGSTLVFGGGAGSASQAGRGPVTRPSPAWSLSERSKPQPGSLAQSKRVFIIKRSWWSSQPPPRPVGAVLEASDSAGSGAAAAAAAAPEDLRSAGSLGTDVRALAFGGSGGPHIAGTAPLHSSVILARMASRAFASAGVAAAGVPTAAPGPQDYSSSMVSTVALRAAAVRPDAGGRTFTGLVSGFGNR